MIEADIVYGSLVNEHEKLPIMAHPPNLTSDISLEGFLSQIIAFNQNASKENQKGVKLDFKTTGLRNKIYFSFVVFACCFFSSAVFVDSIPVLKNLWEQMSFPKWINADIYRGPLNSETNPVDALAFFKGVKDLKGAILSTGWTTRWGPDFKEGKYTEQQVAEMVNGIKSNNITNDITFPVRAGIASQSISELSHLYQSLNETNNVSFTLWSPESDFINIDKLREFIVHFGVEKVYVDLPSNISEMLDLM